MRKLFNNSLLVLFFLSFSLAWADESRAYPSLFFSQSEIPAIRAKINSGTWIDDAWQVLIARADEYMNVSTAPYLYAGKYNGRGTIGRALEKKVGTLAFVGYMTEEKKYFDKAIEMVLSAASQSDPEDKEFWLTHLQVGDGGRAYAIAYDWLYPYMTESQRDILKQEVYKFGKWLYEDKTVWGMDDPGVSSCNHNAVHYGGLGLCALVLGDQPQWLDRAVKRVNDYFKYAMDDTGYFTEGHSYANYGLLGSVPFSYAYQRETGIDIIAAYPTLAKMTDQFCWKLLPTGKDFLAMNDNPPDLGHGGLLMYPIARYGNEQALWCWLEAVGNNGTKTFGIGRNRYEGDGLSVPFAILWADTNLKPKKPSIDDLGLSHKFSSGRVFMRDNWLEPLGTLVSFTSGIDFHRGHNHQDENSFTFYSKGEDFAIDPGYMPNYTIHHNTILVDGFGQTGNSSGRITGYNDSGDYTYVAGQAPEAYVWTEEVLVGHFQRQLIYVREPLPHILIADSIQQETDAPSEYIFLLNTAKGNKVDIDANKAVITGSRLGNICEVSFINPIDGRLKIHDFGDTTFLRRGSNVKHSNYIKQIRFESKSLNPYFITLLVARASDEDSPKVISVKDGDEVTVSVDFGNRGTSRFTVSESLIKFESVKN